jgi:hypothetical protein
MAGAQDINTDDDFDRVGLAHVEGSPEVRT